MSVESLAPVLNVSSISESFEWFEALGWQRGFSWNQAGLIEAAADSNEHGPAEFGSVCAEGATIFLCQDCQGKRGARQAVESSESSEDGMWMSCWIDSVGSLDALHTKAGELGYSITQAPTDEPWGAREFHLRHPDGHVFRVSCGLGKNR